jgi:hypothetical protein
LAGISDVFVLRFSDDPTRQALMKFGLAYPPERWASMGGHIQRSCRSFVQYV